MSIQTIIDKAQAIEFDRRAVVAQSVSRSQRIKTAERNTGQPLQMTVTPPGMLRYSANRGVIEAIMTTDRVTEVQVNLANNSKLNYLTSYQGGLRLNQAQAVTISAFTLTSMTLGNLPTIGSTTTNTTTFVTSSTVIFASGDYIQPAGSRYPYIVSNTVIRGTDSVVTATVHRNLITSEATTVTGAILVGNSCTFRMIVNTLPTYKLVSNDRVQFTGDFSLIEKII
jgi:hypothetical protein